MTADPSPSPAPAWPSKKRAAAPAAAAKPPVEKKKIKTAKKSTAHALLWICAAGKGHGRAWKKKSLKIVGVYADKAAADEKKRQVMEKHDELGQCCGHGDILVGPTWEDEIDLVVRPVEEVAL